MMLRWWGAMVVVALTVACGNGGAPVEPVEPGGQGGIELRYVSPRLQVVPEGRLETLTLALRVTRVTSDGMRVPFSGARFEVRRSSGEATLSSTRARADVDGVATVAVTSRTSADRSEIRFILEGDALSFLPFEVVTAPIVPVGISAGTIEEVDVPRNGAILRFTLDNSTDYVLMPYQIDAERVGTPYRFLFTGDEASPSGVALGIDGLSPPRAGSGVMGGSRRRGPRRTGLDPSARISQSVNIRSCGVDVDREAPLRYLGQRLALYVDAPVDQHQARIDSLGRIFDESIYPLNTLLYGETTDEDDNGVILAVMTPELQGLGGIYCDTVHREGLEAFNAFWNASDAIDRPLSTLTHEHQHVINAGHDFRQNSAREDLWLNEGMSYAAEVLHGYWGPAIIRLWAFLAGQNGGLSMLPLEYNRAFDANYMLFALYLGDRFGQGVFEALGASNRRGRETVEAVTDMNFDDLLVDWFVAMAVSNRGLNSDPRYNYDTIDLHGMADQIAECACVPVTRFDGLTPEPLRLDIPFDIFRNLDQADADYYRLVSEPGGGPRPYDIYYDTFGRQGVRLVIIRNR
jgi:hypothetical protein